jgi:hypothetical protein
MKQVWQSNDGKCTGTKTEVEQYETQQIYEKEEKEEKEFRRLQNTYWYTSVNKHPLNTYGVWLVRGEDPNCDMGGPHYMPTLGYFEGTLEQVLRKAVMLPKFWQWGGGGDATLVNTIKL